MTGDFVPFYPLAKGRASAKVGWITDANGCDIWQGASTRAGYGRAWDRSTRTVRVVHRIRYEREVGPIPSGTELDHFVCDNPRCCNPLHVRPVSRRENALRGRTVSSAAAARTCCPKGHPFEGENLVVDRRGYRRCRTCQREQCLASYYRNGEKCRERMTEYRKLHHERLRTLAKARRDANRVAVNARRKELRARAA